jgi:hypothetical protein
VSGLTISQVAELSERASAGITPQQHVCYDTEPPKRREKSAKYILADSKVWSNSAYGCHRLVLDASSRAEEARLSPRLVLFLLFFLFQHLQHHLLYSQF